MSDERQLTVVVDPGHGGPFRGRVVEYMTRGSQPMKRKITEAEVNLILATALAAHLKMYGINALMTRERDLCLSQNLDMDLSSRAKMADLVGADLLLSVHCNGFKDEGVSGFEVFTTPGETKSDPIAEEIFSEVEKTRLLRMRPDTSDGDHDREANFAVLRGCRCPAVLVEFGFLTNEEDRNLLTGSSSMDICAAVARGVAHKLIRG